MPKFTYNAVNKKGENVNGTIEASTKEAVADTLTKQGLKPLLIKLQKTGFDPNNININLSFLDRVRTKDLVIFTRQLSTMVNAGVPLVRSLATLQNQTQSKKLKTVLAAVTKDVEAGIQLADALEKHPSVFSEVYVNMVRAGEAGGILDDILKKLAFQQEKDASIKKKLKGAMTYPAVLMFITIIAFFALTIFVVPKIGAMVKSLAGEDATLPIQTTIMLGISDFLRGYWFIWIPAIVGTIIALRAYIKTKSGKRNFHLFLLKAPIVKTIVTKVAVARFSRTFASLMSAGVTVLEAIHTTSGAIGNIIIAEELNKAAEAVKNGKQLSEPLSESKIFPAIVSQMLAVGEETGQTDTILIKVADFYEEEVDTLVDSMSSIIEPIMIVIMGAMVGLIAASVIGPISSLTKQIK
ncbi:type II secretion system F family protein [Candidatus Saccharibacteria bacterium CPR2]|nr:type II secretion system F family protein [Candidatus Saccharibacteria bacterium CPR2]